VSAVVQSVICAADPWYVLKLPFVHIHFFEIVLIAAFIAGLIRYRVLQPRPLRWLVPFLGLTIIVEGIGMYMVARHIVNHWMYNFFTCFEFLFYSYIYLQLIENPKWKRVIAWSMVVYPVLFLLNIFFVEGFLRFHTITYRVGSVMVVFWCYLYLRQLMRSPAFLPIFRNPVFWITTGLLFFYTGFFFYMSAAYILLYTKLVIDRVIWEAISGTLNVILYGSFFISFICQGIQKKKLSR